MSEQRRECVTEDECIYMPWCKIRGVCQVPNSIALGRQEDGMDEFMPDKNGFEASAYSQLRAALMAATEDRVLRARLSNNLNVILSALDIAALAAAQRASPDITQAARAFVACVRNNVVEGESSSQAGWLFNHMEWENLCEAVDGGGVSLSSSGVHETAAKAAHVGDENTLPLERLPENFVFSSVELVGNEYGDETFKCQIVQLDFEGFADDDPRIEAIGATPRAAMINAIERARVKT